MDEQSVLTGPAPGFVKVPDYVVDMEAEPRRIRVMVNGEALVDSTNALLMIESNHRPVYYFPRTDVRMDLLERSDHDSY